ncbi:MAG TPA: V-type ATPase subunit [Candidatus Merdenecus merdavium]|nr:V-type ATPase subunit [Candidatus Merdenecus merdavium]
MGKLLSYSGITTKIKAMQSKLITPEQFEELLSLESINDSVVYLKHLPGYEEIFSSYNEVTLHRQEIEKLLTNTIYRDFTKIYRFSNVEQRKYLDLYFKRYEIILLKTCLRMVFDHRDADLDLTIFKSFFDRHSKMDITKLSGSTSIEDLVNNLKGCEYYGPLNKLEHVESPTLFDYEMALDLYYFSTIWKTKNKILKKQELKIISEDQGCKFDILNILWIYRSKKYYNMSNADIYAALIPINFKLTKEDVTHLVEATTADDFSNYLQNTYYARHYQRLLEDNETANSIEAFYAAIRNNLHDTHARKYPYSIAMINSYLYKKEHEIDKLTTVLEIIRYKADPSFIDNYIVK